MLKCREVVDRASLLIDDELPPLQKLSMRLHLAMCRGCRIFVQQLRISRDLTKLATGESTTDFARDVDAILSQVGPHRGNRK